MDEHDEPRSATGLTTKQRSFNKKDPHKRSTLMNAGMSASRKGLKD